MTNSELYFFAGRCLMLDKQPEVASEIRDKINAGDFDDQKFVTLCSDHLILPAICIKFQRHGILPGLPAELQAFLQEIYELNTERNRQILAQISQVTELLNRHNIYPVFLKGAAYLLEELYSEIGERILGDIDFLVPEKDYLKAARILEKDGYSMFEDYLKYVDAAECKHYPRISKPGLPADLEIHQALSQERLSWFNPHIIFEEMQQVPMQDGCFVLSDRHQILHNFIHAQISHDGHNSGIVSFRDMYDLFLLSKRFSPVDTLPIIRYRQKAIAYYILAGKALGLREPLCPNGNLSSWFYTGKHALNMNSAIFYHTFRTVRFLFHKIFTAYLGQLVKSIYSKRVRQSVFCRLTDRQWYKAHFQTYRDFF